MHLLAFAETIQLFPDGTIFIHIGLVLLMIWLLNRTLFKPINRVIATREMNKGGHSSEAEAILNEVTEKESLYEREMLAARSAGYSLIEKEHKELVAERNRHLAEAKAATVEQLSRDKAEVQKQVADARSTISTEADKMADKIAANILNA